nr:uncharacterized protein PB18E9.04c-like isoform X2 [Procambarus clarkii]
MVLLLLLPGTGSSPLSSPNSAEVSGSPSPAPSSIGNNAPKYGTLVPNRVFVGGISASTTEQDLLELFSQYGAVKATKIISDRAGVSKGYGFVTFETEEEARRLTQEADNIMLKDRKLNIAPAIKKQVSDVGYMKTYSPHLIESNSNVVGSGGAVFFSNGTSYATYGNTVPVLTPTEYHPTFPQAPAAPTTPSAYQTLVYPQPIYYPQQYQYQPTQTVQPQWGAAPQWRWITPLSYAQPECGPQQCSVEPSSQAQGEFATASVLGSSPLASTPITLACPSTPTTATTTTAVCTAFTTTSSTSTKTTATTSTITKSVRTHDTLLQIKPLSLASKSTLCGKSKSIPTVVPKTTLSLDKNNNTAEGSKVGGGSVNGTPPSTLQTSHPGSYVQSHHNNRSSNGDSDSSSNSNPTTNKISISNNSVVSSTSTIHSSCHNSQSKTDKNCGLVSHMKNMQVGATQKVQELESSKPLYQMQMKSGSPIGVGSHPFHVPGCYMEVMSNSSSNSTTTTTNNSSSNNNNNKNSSSLQSNNIAGTGEWPPVTPVGKSAGWGSHLGHSTSCPHHTGGMTPLPGSPTTLQASHLLMSPSWTSLGWPLTPSHTRPFNPRNTTDNNHNNVNKAMWLPHQSHSTLRETLPCAGAQLQQSSQDPQSSACPQASGTLITASHTNTPTIQGKGTSPCLITVPNSSSLTTSLTNTSSNKTTSPLSNSTQSVSPYLAPYPGSGLKQMTYGYMNQAPLLMMPYYQYGGTATPCYQWASPVVMQWPLTPTPTPHHSTPTQTVASKVSGTFQPRLTLPFTPWSPENKTIPKPQSMTVKSSEVISSSSSNNSQCSGPNHGNITISKMNPCLDRKVHAPAHCVSPNTYEKLSGQKQTDGCKVSNSGSSYKISSPCKVVSSPHKFPKPVLQSSPHQVVSARQCFGSHAEVDVSVLPPLQDDHCVSVPMTPPSTPLLDTDNPTAAVANLNES